MRGALLALLVANALLRVLLKVLLWSANALLWLLAAVRDAQLANGTANALLKGLLKVQLKCFAMVCYCYGCLLQAVAACYIQTCLFKI